LSAIAFNKCIQSVFSILIPISNDPKIALPYLSLTDILNLPVKGYKMVYN
jgi:hypothetical protein